MTKFALPKSIKVRVDKCGDDKFIAILPDFNSHTEAESEFELLLMVNDLIMTIFDIPSEFHNKIIYAPQKRDDGLKRVEPFIRLTSPDVLKHLNG